MLAQHKGDIPPLVVNSIRVPRSALRFSAACFAGSHWTLSQIRTPELAKANATFAEELATALRGVGAARAFAPNPTEFNGKVIEPEALTTKIDLPYGVAAYRNTALPADGAYLRRAGDAGIFSAGGCGMVVVACKEHLLFAHAGRESLLDRAWVRTRGASRSRPADLVDNLVDALLEKGCVVGDIFAWPMYFIAPSEFVHHRDDKDPAHAEYNRAAMAFLPREFAGAAGEVDEERILIDLPRIARAQFLRRGVPDTQVFLDHAYLSDELPHTRKGGGRYLVATVRH